MKKRKRDGIWYVYVHQDGKRIFRSLGTRDEAIAKSRESEILKQDQIITPTSG